MMLFGAATQGFWVVKSRRWETVALLLIAFTLVRPGYWIDQFQEPWVSFDVNESALNRSDLDGQVQLTIEGPDFDDPDQTTQLILLVKAGQSQVLATALDAARILARAEDQNVLVDEPFLELNTSSPCNALIFMGTDLFKLLTSRSHKQIDSRKNGCIYLQ